jgi:hypothetical protein
MNAKKSRNAKTGDNHFLIRSTFTSHYARKIGQQQLQIYSEKQVESSEIFFLENILEQPVDGVSNLYCSYDNKLPWLHL